MDAMEEDFRGAGSGARRKGGVQAVATTALSLLRMVPKPDRRSMVASAPTTSATPEALEGAFGKAWPAQAIRGVAKLDKADRVALGEFLEHAPRDLLTAIAEAMRSDDHLRKYGAFDEAARAIRTAMQRSDAPLPLRGGE